MAPDSAMTDLEQGMAFGRYLLGDAPSEDALRLFVRAAATKGDNVAREFVLFGTIRHHHHLVARLVPEAQ